MRLIGDPVLNRRLHPFVVQRDGGHYARFTNLAVAMDCVLFFDSESGYLGPQYSIVDEVTFATYDAADCRREVSRVLAAARMTANVTAASMSVNGKGSPYAC